MTAALAATSATSDRQDGRQRVLDSAAALFLDRGYAQTSLRDIATDAGMKAGSVYYHFESKEDLLKAILLRGMAVMDEAFEVIAVEVSDAPAANRVAAHIRAHLAALFEFGPYTAAHVSTFHTAPAEVRSEIVPARDSYERLWAGLLRDLAHRGELADDLNLGLARLVLFGSMNSAIDWFDPERSSVDELAQTIARQFWSGVAARGGERR
jgi:AcrR family transcriptional regulator